MTEHKTSRAAPPETAPEEIVRAMAGRTVIVVGDIMLDRFVYGDVHRISPESPVPVLSVGREAVMLGGAGNVLSNLAGLGVAAHILALAGDDEAGAAVRGLVRDCGADPDGLLVAPGRPTTVKTRFLAGHQHLLRVDAECTADIDEAAAQAVLARLKGLLPGAGALVLSDYGKGFLTPSLIAAMIAAAEKAGVPVLVDPKKGDYALYDGASAVTPNRKELAAATGGMAVATDAEIEQAARALMRHARIGAVIATRSQDGLSILRGPGAGGETPPPVHLRAAALEVFDVSGAGDTVIATAAAALAAGADLVTAADLANVAAGLVVAKSGTAAVQAAELCAALRRREAVGAEDARGEDARGHDAGEGVRGAACAGAGGALRGGARDRTAGPQAVESAAEPAGDEAAARFFDWDAARDMMADWRAQGLKVGFTNGCFDILHPGHVSYLQQARARCDRLVLGLNADESVRRLKGPSRPVNGAVARAVVLAALGAVDLVVIFGTRPEEDDKPVSLIAHLRPDIFFKGGDYTIDRLPEAAVVQSYGGTVAIMPHYEGHSTTATIAKMAGR